MITANNATPGRGRWAGTTAESRFWSKVNKDGPTQPHMTTPCWEWTGTIYRKYGRTKFAGEHVRAHRVAFLLSGGALSGEKPHVMHMCDNPPCCNPGHLRACSHKENMADMAQKGRTATVESIGRDRFLRTRARGERCGSSKLTSDTVREIRGRYSAGGVRQCELAQEYGVSRSTIKCVVNNQLWKHVQESA